VSFKIPNVSEGYLSNALTQLPFHFQPILRHNIISCHLFEEKHKTACLVSQRRLGSELLSSLEDIFIDVSPKWHPELAGSGTNLVWASHKILALFQGPATRMRVDLIRIANRAHYPSREDCQSIGGDLIFSQKTSTT
jgi:hypothetical protein